MRECGVLDAGVHLPGPYGDRLFWERGVPVCGLSGPGGAAGMAAAAPSPIGYGDSPYQSCSALRATRILSI